LQLFIKEEDVKESENKQEEFSDVKMSKPLPMKFGIRKKLLNDSVDFRIVNSDLHIVVFNKVLIQVYSPRILMKNDNFPSEIQDLGKLYELFILTFDFIDFSEEYAGEKRYLKKMVSEFKEIVKFQIIPIENEEELYFILKSILESIPKKGS